MHGPVLFDLDVHRTRYREVAGTETAVFDGLPARLDAVHGPRRPARANPRR